MYCILRNGYVCLHVYENFLVRFNRYSKVGDMREVGRQVCRHQFTKLQNKNVLGDWWRNIAKTITRKPMASDVVQKYSSKLGSSRMDRPYVFPARRCLRGYFPPLVSSLEIMNPSFSTFHFAHSATSMLSSRLSFLLKNHSWSNNVLNVLHYFRLCYSTETGGTASVEPYWTCSIFQTWSLSNWIVSHNRVVQIPTYKGQSSGNSFVMSDEK